VLVSDIWLNLAHLQLADYPQPTHSSRTQRSEYPHGYATTIDPSEIHRLKSALALPPEALNTPAAGM